MIAQRHDAILSFELVTDPEEVRRAVAQRARFDRNAAWLQANADRVYRENRGRCICISGEEMFVAATPEAALAAAAAKHPDDDGRFVRYIPREKVDRIYAN